ncbi:hypothetical protein MY11210_006294 [Beauveria gryllotalpidicola]
MSDEDIFRLAAETRESSIERKRLEGKRETLEARLQGLKNLLKRRNIVSSPQPRPSEGFGTNFCRDTRQIRRPVYRNW